MGRQFAGAAAQIAGMSEDDLRKLESARHKAPHEANLFDLHAKYAEAVSEADALSLVRART